MGLTKKELIKLKEELKISEEKIEKLEDTLESERNKVNEIRKKIVNNCNHIIVVSDYDPEEGWEEDDDPTYYHTCIKCGLTTKLSHYLELCYQTRSIYGYNTKIHIGAHTAKEKYQKLLQEKPNISDEEIVMSFIKEYKSPEFVKNYKLKKENTSYSHS